LEGGSTSYACDIRVKFVLTEDEVPIRARWELRAESSRASGSGGIERRFRAGGDGEVVVEANELNGPGSIDNDK
jgi:hypothetical protein